MRPRRSLAVLTVVVALVSMSVPQADACHVRGAVPHDCCAQLAAVDCAHSAPCCASDTTCATHSATTQAPAQKRCHCVHAPTGPEAVTVGTPTPADGGIAPAASHATTPAAGTPWTRHSSRPDRDARSAPFPLFLLECAFLI